MRTVSCCLTVFLVTTIPTTPVTVFHFWAFIFSPSEAVTENQPVLELGV